MKLLNERNQVRGVAQRWQSQYGSSSYGGRMHRIANELKMLDDETASASDVAAIIGNTSWVEPQTCDECGAKTWDVVQLGEEPDYESATACVCADCLRKALALIGGTGESK